jgi:hypothetical protein
MAWCPGVRAPRVLLAIFCVLALAGCSIEERQDASAAQPRGATVAFESIDGPPPEQFHRLVQDLNSEAQSRRLAVLSRESQSAYRVRGYLAAEAIKGKTTVSWVWDVFDGEQKRVFRVTGEETAAGRYADAWQAADEAMLGRIANKSMTQLASFLTSPEVAPGAAEPVAGARMVRAGTQDSSPEAAGIFRIFQAHADPAPVDEVMPAAEPVAGPVPLPRRRPLQAAAVSARETPTLTASR